MKLTIFSDGATRGNPGPSSAAAILRSESGEIVAIVAEFLGESTNNRAEYLAVFAGIRRARELGADEVALFLDSKLAVEQIAGRWKIKNPELKILAGKIAAELSHFRKWSIAHIPREKNRDADAAANKILDEKGFKKSVFWSGGFRDFH